MKLKMDREWIIDSLDVADDIDLVLPVPIDQMEKSPELRQKRASSGLEVLTPTVLVADENISTCVYDDNDLDSYKHLTCISKPGRAAEFKYCSKCGVRYAMPPTEEDARRITALAEKFNRGLRRAEEKSA